MTTLFKYGAIASVFLMTAGTAAVAQTYNPSGNNMSQGYQPGYAQGYNPNVNPAYDNQDWNQSGSSQPGWNQQGMWGGANWNQPGMQESSGFHNNQQAFGYGGTTGFPSNQHEAWQELLRYGYGNIHDLHPIQGWAAHATRNGDRVRVMVGENGAIATFRGP